VIISSLSCKENISPENNLRNPSIFITKLKCTIAFSKGNFTSRSYGLPVENWTFATGSPAKSLEFPWKI
jgi:hypothetical protein